jgi:hypothetical protein
MLLFLVAEKRWNAVYAGSRSATAISRLEIYLGTLYHRINCHVHSKQANRNSGNYKNDSKYFQAEDDHVDFTSCPVSQRRRRVPKKLRIARYRRADRDVVFQLIRAAYRSDTAERLIRQWDWKFDSNPFNAAAEQYRQTYKHEYLGRLSRIMTAKELEAYRRNWDGKSETLAAEHEDDPYVLLLKDETGAAFEMLCSLPQRVTIEGKRHCAAVGCDWALLPKYRKRGLSLPIGIRMRTENPLNFGWANATAEGIMRKKLPLTQAGSQVEAAATDHRRLVPMVRPLDLAHLIRGDSASRLVRIAAAALVVGTRPITKVLSRSSLPNVTINQIESFDDRFDRLWDRCCRDYGVVAVRDSEYLNWRFISRPDALYTVLAASRGRDLIGYIVCRVANIDGAAWGYIVDYLVEDRSMRLFSMLLQHAVSYFAETDVKGIVCSVATAPFRSALVRHGFYPVLFRGESYVRVARNDQNPILQQYADLRSWFMTMADGDLEMAF